MVFLINGLSYLFSAFTELFINVPVIKSVHEKQSFFSEMKTGLLFTWRHTGLRHLFINSFISNFAILVGYTLILPLFQQDAQLGPGLYGLVTASAAVGALICLLLSSAIHFKPGHRFAIMCAMGVTFSLSRMVFPFFLHMYIMVPLMFISGFALSIPIIFFDAVIPPNVPVHMRGKVFSLLGTVTSGVWPLGMITAGVLAEFFHIPTLIAISSLVALMSYAILFFSTPAKEVINFESG
jgi:hypothetical protein